jgi:hypothetical protein
MSLLGLPKRKRGTAGCGEGKREAQLQPGKILAHDRAVHGPCLSCAKEEESRDKQASAFLHLPKFQSMLL